MMINITHVDGCDTDYRITTLTNVREYGEGDPVELWRVKGRVVVRCFNEGHYNWTDLDLTDLLTWVKRGKA